jgi:hypothetical protein
MTTTQVDRSPRQVVFDTHELLVLEARKLRQDESAARAAGDIVAARRFDAAAGEIERTKRELHRQLAGYR